MKVLVLGFLYFVTISPSSCSLNAPLSSSPTEQCTTENGTGICVEKEKCTCKGGINLGFCDQGNGQCCRYTAQCTTWDSVTVTRNLTTLITPPVEHLPKTCTFVFPRLPGVCQLRLDFPRFNLNAATAAGQCLNDSLSISGTVTVNELDICGIGASEANHMYLDYGTSDGPIVIRIKTSGGSTIANYGYEIRATQIMCNSAKRVPQDCLQHYTSQSGVVSSYNYPIQQLNNENYKVCVEKQFPGNRIQWSLCNTTDFNSAQPRSPDMCLKGYACVLQPAPASCYSDYVEIPGSLTRFCRLNQFLRSDSVTSENFWIRVNLDDRELQVLRPDINHPDRPCSDFDPNEFRDYILTDQNGGCYFKPRNVDLGNTGFCLAYTVV